MQIDLDLISHLEHLARLELSPEERNTLIGDLNNILAMVGQLEGIDVSGVSPMVYMHETANPLRPDVAAGGSNREDALRNAPENDGVYFMTPKVIDLKKS